MDIHIIDLSIFILYLVFMLGVGFFYLRKNNSEDDYYVGGRSMSAGHVGLSVVATDVGGGFSIGLGGLGFAIGLSGSWMLFTGLIGAWLSTVLLIPKVYKTARDHNFLTFPQVLNHHFGAKVALLAGIISLIGYIGFTSSQILAGAKLASATFPSVSLDSAVLIMGVIAVIYTVIGGIKAVIYTDTIQWIILMAGLIFIGLPLGYDYVGGWDAIRSTLGPEFFSLTNITFVEIINWVVTIVPIWFVGMTLYQRIFACRDEKTAIKAWRIAGLFEWPIMAFMGILLGLFARVAFEQGVFVGDGFPAGSAFDEELGLPLLLKTILPVGLMGLMMSAYFSAIMSTADSCLMAASGNITTDILKALKKNSLGMSIRSSQLITLVIGTIAVIIATAMEDVLDLMLHSYAFMVAGMLVPVLAMLLSKRKHPAAAFWSMITGGSSTLLITLTTSKEKLFGLDPIVFGLMISGLTYIIISSTTSPKKELI